MKTPQQNSEEQAHDTRQRKRPPPGLVGLVKAALPRQTEQETARPTPCWTPNMDALLGLDTDHAVAAKLGLERDQVFYRRLMLRIPVFKAPNTV
ncbi:hypothetical protein ACU4GI_33265 [Cupriavidus basilensis]